MAQETEKKVSAVSQVFDNIINEIIEGRLRPGDRLPTESELSEKYHIGRNSVREAIKQLQAFGILIIRRADGTFVSDSYNQKMLDPLLYSLILQDHDWRYFVQLRSAMEIGVLHLAVDSDRRDETVTRLEELIRAMEQEVGRARPSVERLLELDLAFHDAVSAAVANPMVDSVTNYIARLTVPSRRATTRKWLKDKNENRFVELHRQIVDVLKNKDKSRIEEVVEAHYAIWSSIRSDIPA